MSFLPKVNDTRLSGYVANTYIQNGQWGPWGSITVAVDDSYFKKGENGQDGSWIERTYFIDVSVNSKALEKMPNVGKGDFIFIEGKNIEQKKEGDQNGQKATSYKKVEARAVLMHYPADVARELNERAKQQRNQQNNNQSNNYQGNNYQGNNGGGGQRANNNPNGYQQNNNQRGGNGGNGGYQRNNSNNNNGGGQPNAPQSGGYQRQQRSGGYQQNNGYDQGPQH